MRDQPSLLLNERMIDVDKSLQIPYPDDEDERTAQGYRDQMSSRKDSGVRSRSRTLSSSRPRRGSQSHGPPAKQRASVGQESDNPNGILPLSNQTLLPTEPPTIAIHNPSSPPSIAGSPSSRRFVEALPDLPQYGNHPTCVSRSPTLSDTTDSQLLNPSPSTSFEQSFLSGRFALTSDQHLSRNWDASSSSRIFEQEQHSPPSPYASLPSLSSVGPSGSSTQSYLSTDIAGFTGMLGGQTLPQFPSFGIPINANGSFLLDHPGSNSNYFYLSESPTVTEHLQMRLLDSNMDDFDQLLIAD